MRDRGGVVLWTLVTLAVGCPAGIVGADAGPVMVTRDRGTYPFALHADLLEDPTRRLTIKDLSRPEVARRFMHNRDEIPNFGFSSSVFWIRFRVQAAEQLTERYLVEASYSLFDHVALYIHRGGGRYTVKQAGLGVPFARRDLKTRHIVFHIPTPTAAPRTFYLRYQTRGTMRFSMTLWTFTAYAEQTFRSNYGYGVFYGSFLVMFVFNLLLFLFLRDRAYLYYTLFILTYAGFQVLINGVALELLTPETTWWKFRAYIFLACMPMVFSFMFARLFLDMSRHAPRLDRLFIVMMALVGTLGVLSLATDALVVFRLKLLGGLVLVWSVINLAAGTIFFVRGFRPARFYMLAWFFFTSGVLIFALQSFGVLPANVLTLYSMQIGSLLNVILLSIALPDKLLTMRREKEQAQARALEQEKMAREAQEEMTRAFGRFVPQEFLKLLERDSIVDIKLGDQVEKEMVILFSDIREFTALSEKMSPQENFQFINSYLGKIVPVVRRSGGFIDKFIGDAIMALFLGPVASAISSAVQMQMEVRRYNEAHEGGNYPPIRIGVGLHIGRMMLGTIGEETRMETTVISDAVNLASRIEGLTKVYGCGILVSGNMLQSEIPFTYRHIDLVQVKGKREAIEVFEIVDGLPPDDFALKVETREDFKLGIERYRARDMAGALERFEAVVAANPEDRAATVYVARCKRLIKDGIPEGWDGIEHLDSK